MNQKQIIVNVSHTISECIEKMNNVSDKGGFRGIAVVLDTKNKLKGVITDGDIRRAFNDNLKLNDPVSDIMTPDPITFKINKVSPKFIPEIFDEMSKKGRYTSKIVILDDNDNFYDIIDLNRYLHTNVYKNKSIIIYGMGFVGLTLGLVIAETNFFKVTGYDIDNNVINKLKDRIPPFFEKGITESLSNSLDSDKITFTTNPNNHFDIHIVTVGTPIDNNNIPNLLILEKCITQLSKFLKRGDLIIFRSTVPVGTTRNFALPLVEKISKMVGGIDFHIAFAPERTIEGNALSELKTLPQIIAGLTPTCTQLACVLFEKFSSSIIRLKTLEEAEMVKLINNSYRDLVFSFANEVALNCDKYNIDAFNLIRSANEGYPRNKIPEPSPGVGGSCLTKDPYLYISSQEEGSSSLYPKRRLSQISRDINSRGVQYAIHQFNKFKKSYEIKQQIKPLIIGLAFKGWPETDDTRFSVGLELAQKLISLSYDIRVFDHVVKNDQIKKQGIKPYNPETDKVNAIFIMNNHPANYKFDLEKIISDNIGKIYVFDGFGLLNKDQIISQEKVIYSTLGFYQKG